VKPRVYVDFDDVLCETAQALMGLLERMFRRRVRFESIWSFDLSESFGLGPEELASFMVAAHAPEVIEAIEPMEGAAEALRRWIRSGIEVCIVTGRPPSTEAASRQWLKRHKMPCLRLMFVDKYSREFPLHCGPGAITLDRLVRMEFSLAVDDAPMMLDFLAKRMAMPVVVFDRPWNACVKTGGRVRRCRSWSEIGSLPVASFGQPRG
jgi:uncharacterized HAD superfamily protein